MDTKWLSEDEDGPVAKLARMAERLAAEREKVSELTDELVSQSSHITELLKRLQALEIELAAERERNAELIEALRMFVDWHGGCHEDDCSLDDTCSCKGKPINDAVNAVLAKNDYYLGKLRQGETK